MIRLLWQQILEHPKLVLPLVLLTIWLVVAAWREARRCDHHHGNRSW